LKKLTAFLIVLAIIIASSMSCKSINGDNDEYIRLLEADFWYSPYSDGAYIGMDTLWLDHYNLNREPVTIIVDWSNGTSSSAELMIPATQKNHYATHDFIECHLECPEKLIFNGKKTVTIKVTMERQGEAVQTLAIPFEIESW
jgi:hypothetical protein